MRRMKAEAWFDIVVIACFRRKGYACSAMRSDTAPSDIFCLGDMDSCYTANTFAANHDRLRRVLQAVEDERVPEAIVKTLLQNSNRPRRG